MKKFDDWFFSDGVDKWVKRISWTFAGLMIARLVYGWFFER